MMNAVLEALSMGKHGVFVWSTYWIYFMLMGYWVFKLTFGFRGKLRRLLIKKRRSAV